MNIQYPVTLLIPQGCEKNDKEIIENNPHLRKNFVRSAHSFNEGCCFNYALKTRELHYVEDSYDYIQEFYKQIPISKAKRGDIVVYLENLALEPREISKNDTARHFAIISKTNGTIKGTIIRSKWGTLGIYKTDIFNIPEEYGDYIEIWTKDKGVI